MLEVTNRQWEGERLDSDDHLAPEGRVMEMLSEHQCQGWLEGYLLTGRHGLFTSYEAFIHIVDSMFNQHAKWLKSTNRIPWRRPIGSLNYLLSSHVWRQDHNGFSHQDPGFIDHVVNKKAEVIRVYLPPDTNCLLSVGDHCLRSRQYVNVIVAGKQPSLNYLSMPDAVLHCTRGIGIWDWASNDDGDPDVVMACCGDIPTLETLAAVDMLRLDLPKLEIRVINVVDLMRLQPQSEHPHGMSDPEFDILFTKDKPVIFAYHGYPWLVHRLTYRRANHANMHVRGYKEEGTTTTPFDMVMLNDLDRFHLVMDVIDRVPFLGSRARPRFASTCRTSGFGRPSIPGSRAKTRPKCVIGPGRTRAAPPSRPSTCDTRRRPRTDAHTGRQRRLEQPQAVGPGRGGQPPRHLRRSRLQEAKLPPRPFDASSKKRGRLTLWAIAWCTEVLSSPQPVLIDANVVNRLEALTDLAPLHQPKSLQGLRAVSAVLPHVAAVACFDTAFHATIPPGASTYALPQQWRRRWELRRYGFHGLSHSYASRRVRAELMGELMGEVPLRARHLSPRRGGLAGSCAGRDPGRHDDGFYTSGGAGHGDPIGFGRPRAPPVAGAPRWDPTRRARFHSGAPLGACRPNRDGGHAPGPPGRGCRRRGRGRWPWGSTCTGSVADPVPDGRCP